MIATLRQRNFALLWFAGLISFTGDWMLFTALPYYVYQRTGSTLATATMTVVSILPSVLLSSLAGVFVDRWNRKRILVVSNLLQMLTVLLLLLVGRSALFWVVYAVALAQSTISTFTIPAENALLPRLVDQRHLLSANALNSLNNNFARLIGPPLGGVLLAVLGLEVVVLLNSVSFGCAAALIALITIPAQLPKEDAQRATSNAIKTVAEHWAAFWHEWLEGLTAIRKDRLIVTLMVVLGITTFGGTMLDPLYPAFAQDIVRAGAIGFGWLLTTQAIGGIIGGVVIGHLGTVLPTARILACGNMIIGCMLLVQFNVPWLPLALLIAFLIGPEQVAAGAALQTLLQHNVADPLKGRVFGAISATNALLSMLGGGVAGSLGNMIGIVPSLNIAAGLTIAAGVLALIVLPKTISERARLMQQQQ